MPEIKQNFGCHKFKDDVESFVTRWSVIQNMGLRQEQRENLPHNKTKFRFVAELYVEK
jgi:hypothetical protein